MDRKLLLVGSVPLDTVEEVLRTFGTALAEDLIALPDGEVGPRTHWISKIHWQVFAGHPELETTRRPAPENGVERLYPRGAGDSWLFRVKDGVAKVRFGDPGWRLGYARDAINSYFVFRTLREKGELPAHLRFQVSMPSVVSVLPPRVFPVPGDLDKIMPGYEDALAAELQNILARIPNGDLAIQWDCSTELQDAYGAVAGLPAEGMVERNVAQFRRLSALIPEGALLGYHLCFGTLGGWPRFAPDDLKGAVRLANAIVEATPRRIDWIHIPVLDRADDAFFAPLADLRPGGARIYLGAVHHMDRFAERIAAARRYLPEFGVGAYCGFGRIPKEELPAVLEEHRRAVAMF